MRSSAMGRFVLTLLLVAASLAAMAMEPIVYRDNAEEVRMRALTEQLRCVMCQNQSLADSNAPIAHDLRLEVLRLMRDGKSDEQIKQYLVERYSEFVLYKPRLEPTTWLLWFGPGLLLLVGAGAVVAIVKKRSRNAPGTQPTDKDAEW